jgi:aminoglycoside phosphotransferase family enzyme
MIVLRSATTPPLETHCESSSPLYIPSNLPGTTSEYTDFQITDWNKSPSAQLFLVSHNRTEQQSVIKMLCSYQDTRYSLKTLAKRQQCLLGALQRNRVFTPELYIGLAPLYHLDPHKRTIRIGEVIENPTQTLLDADKEYVLLMKPQDQETRLDYLLENREYESLIPLVMYVTDIHHHKVCNLSTEEGIRWGSYDYLIQKLEHNLQLLDFLVDRCGESDWDDREELANRAIEVRKMAQEFAIQERYCRYFQHRIDQGFIKLCHGDIKSPHIWIASDGRNGQQAWSFNILDAIDFNPMYNHIDILSDFAMLIADVQARAQSSLLVNEMVNCYLRETNQDNEIARAVLDFYILDKAIVGTGISILYDDKPQLGREFLKVAEHRLAVNTRC